jgi:hypothetical protein
MLVAALLALTLAAPLDAGAPVLQAPGLQPQVAAQASAWLRCAQQQRIGTDARRLAVIDYTRPSTDVRLWVFELATGALEFSEHVAHGQGSGGNVPDTFSNQPGSLQSSLGLFLTDDTYVGANGYSLRMHGLNPGLNDAALARYIVMHGADYVDAGIARRQGRLGRSWGCPAVRQAIARPLIDALKRGQFIYAHGPGMAAPAACTADSLAAVPAWARAAGGGQP